MGYFELKYYECSSRLSKEIRPSCTLNLYFLISVNAEGYFQHFRLKSHEDHVNKIKYLATSGHKL